MNLKSYLTNQSILAKLQLRDNLLIYLTVSTTAVSSILVREEEGNVQKPVYNTSKALLDTERRYPKQEQLAIALMVSSRKLSPYFQVHPITVVIEHPLRHILLKPKSLGRLVKWSMKLSEFEIHYRLRNAIKGQAIANFVADFTSCTEGQEVSSKQGVSQQRKEVVT